MQEIKCFEIRVPTDERASELFGHFTNEQIGLKLSEKKGWYGSDGYSIAVHLVVFDTEEEYNNYKYKTHEKRALEKLEHHLTKDEKLALMHYFKNS